jgi:hypothetical protein
MLSNWHDLELPSRLIGLQSFLLLDDFLYHRLGLVCVHDPSSPQQRKHSFFYLESRLNGEFFLSLSSQLSLRRVFFFVFVLCLTEGLVAVVDVDGGKHNTGWFGQNDSIL